MIKRHYLLDTNIVIHLWEDYPGLIDKLAKAEDLKFSVTNDIVIELSNKETYSINSTPHFSSRLMGIFEHMINNDCSFGDGKHKLNQFVMQDSNGELYLEKINNISGNDYSLIVICQNYKQYTLVTDDKKMLKSAYATLGKSNVLNMEEFINELTSFKLF